MTNKPKHTPTSKGTWNVAVTKLGVIVVVDDTTVIAEVGAEGEKGQANAHRIVECVNACEGLNPQAFRDLLEVCEELKHNEWDLGGELCGYCGTARGHPKNSNCLVAKASAAIAKAEGEKE